MKGMIFAAGLGTRLLPLTADKPKALVEYKGMTLLEHAILKLKGAGIKDIIINVHHFADQIIDFIEKSNFNVRISISDESDKLLDTGGGLKKASWFLKDDTFIAYNVDIISSIDLNEFIKYHAQNKALVSLAVRKRNTSRYLLFDSGFQLCGWENVKTGEQIISRTSANTDRFAFSGIQILEPEIFMEMPEENKFSVIDLYLNLARKNRIIGFLDKADTWLDCGSIQNLSK